MTVGVGEMGSRRPACSIIIPVHNKAPLTRDCLATLLAEADDGVDRQLIVVDDGSSDRTPDVLAAFGDRVAIVRHEAAQGFAAACNAGAARAVHPLLLFLNNDTIPQPGWLHALVDCAAAHPEAAVFGAKLLFPNETVQHAGVVFGPNRLPHHVYHGFPADHPAVNKDRAFQAVTGACFLVRRAVWDALDGFDTRYVNGWEDVDFCMRARAAGHAIRYCPESVLYHFESASRDLRAPQERANRERFFARWGATVVPDSFGVYLADDLLEVRSTTRYPIDLAVSPLLARVKVGEESRLGDRLLAERARQVAILVRNNIVLNLRVQEAELRQRAAETRAQEAELRAQQAEARLAAHLGAPGGDARRDRGAVVADSPAAPDPDRPPLVDAAATASLPSPADGADGIEPSNSPIGAEPVAATADVGPPATVAVAEAEPTPPPAPDAAATRPPLPDASAVRPSATDASALPLPATAAPPAVPATATSLPSSRPVSAANVTSPGPLTATGDGPATAPAPPPPPPPPQPEAATPALAPILGRVERPSRIPDVVTGSVLLVVGWAVSRAGIATVEALVDGEVRGTVEYGLTRPDVAEIVPGFPAGEACGFSGAVPVGDLPDGSHALTIRIAGGDGRVAEVSTTFELDATARATGRVVGRLDRPEPGSAPTVHDRLAIGGWTLSARGIRSVAALVDGVPRGQVAYGVLRPEIGASHPDFPNADHCGFSGLISADGLADGPHELRVEITSGGDQTLTLTAPFVVDSSAVAYGEVPDVNLQYGEWLAKKLPSAADLERVRAEGAAFAFRPTIGLVLPLADVDIDVAALDRTVASVREQLYDAWQLVIVAGATTPPDLRARALEHAAADPRISSIDAIDVAGDGPAGDEATAATGAGLARSAGQWCAVIEPGGVLAPHALAEVVRTLQAPNPPDVVYADDDKRDPATGQRWDPFLKPDWSPDLLLSTDYLGPFTAYRRTLLESLGGPRAGLGGAERYDLALRATERTGRIAHVARPLYSRPVPLDVAAAPSPEAVAGQHRALADALARRGIEAAVEPGVSAGRWRVRYALEATPAVTVVMPSGGKLQFLRPCLDDLIGRTSYPNRRILILDNSGGDEVAALCRDLTQAHPSLHLRREQIALKPFNFSALINAGMRFVETPYSLLLNDDVTVITPDWIEAMLEHAQRPEVGVVGAKLLFPDGTFQHAGVILGPYHGTGHVYKQFPGDTTGWFGLPNVVRNASAVTFACALMRTSIFAEVGGLDAEFLPIAFNDVDFCLRVGEAGYRIVYTPHAQLLHHESVTKTVIAKPSEIGTLRRRWARYISHDPFYNPNLTRKAEDASLRMD